MTNTGRWIISAFPYSCVREMACGTNGFTHYHKHTQRRSDGQGAAGHGHDGQRRDAAPHAARPVVRHLERARVDHDDVGDEGAR